MEVQSIICRWLKTNMEPDVKVVDILEINMY